MNNVSDVFELGDVYYFTTYSILVLTWAVSNEALTLWLNSCTPVRYSIVNGRKLHRAATDNMHIGDSPPKAFVASHAQYVQYEVSYH